MAAAAPVRTTCPYCGVGCGLLASPKPDGAVAIQGDPAHPANFGRLCAKGAALAETLGLEGRLLHPEIAGRRASWDEALDLVAERFRQAIDRHGPDSVAFYVSGQFLTEDYYVANKLMKGFIGSGNIDTNSRLCMASAVAAHKRAFGTDTVPCQYTDLEEADLVVLVGSNLAWCHPVLYQRLRAAKAARPAMRVVLIDPRRTATAELADLHLPICPGMDGVLFAGLLVHLHRAGRAATAFVAAHTHGLAAALVEARRHAPDLATVAHVTGLDRADLAQLFAWFADTERTVTLFSQGINQSSSGTDKANAIINVHLLTGRIGKPGAGPFSITGQPNAMGGREVGGLANQLACHVDFDDPVRRRLIRDFWHAPRLARAPGLQAVELFRALGKGRIKALLIMATNPAVSLPDADQVRTALAQAAFVAVADCIRRTDSTARADALLPAAGWGEKDGTVTNSERRISRQRAFRPRPSEARPDWWILTQLARRLGHAKAFPYESPAAIFREHAALAARLDCDFRLGDPAALTDQAYEALDPTLWPIGHSGRPFADGQFCTPNRRARFVPTTPTPPRHPPSARYPLLLNTGRYRDHWHTLTRTGRSVTLSRHRPEPLLDLHPADAAVAMIGEGTLVEIESAHGRALLRARLTEEQPRGSVFAPMHWSGSHAALARINATVAPLCDPISGQPEFKAMPVQVRPARLAWQGFALARTDLTVGDLIYWARSRIEGGWLYELAGKEPIEDWRSWLAERLASAAAGACWLDYDDPSRQVHRLALVTEGRLQAALLVGDGPPRDWLVAQLAKPAIAPFDRAQLLAGRAPGADPGPLVCACYGVGRNLILDSIRKERLTTAEALGAALQAGTNCGSCLPELQALLASATAAGEPVSA